ncbi:MAG: leucine-rich repeat domain-containing protein [Dysgonamonadaceae bacterium]|nr:leucine-rich repeat domain-containing protein [Dysgonamonadaceae bacterium]
MEKYDCLSGEGAMPDYYDQDYAPWYSYRNTITTVVIENSVTSIGIAAFYGCSGLTSVTNYNPTPQNIEGWVFYNVDLSNVTLYVPAESVEDYKAAETWKKFGEIKAYNIEGE